MKEQEIVRTLRPTTYFLIDSVYIGGLRANVYHPQAPGPPFAVHLALPETLIPIAVTKNCGEVPFVMVGSSRASTSYTSATTTYPSYREDESTPSRPGTSMGRATTGRPLARPRTATSTAGGDQQIICAISESRGLSPIVGLAFVNLSTTEAVLCQISDNQTYVKTVHKLTVFEPTEILLMTTAAQPESKLYSGVKAELPHIRVTVIDRKYWAETTGMDYIRQLALKQDIEALKVSVEGNYYAICCFAAVCCS